MLQQTQVSRVELYYGKFLQRYPTIHDLARAQPAEVRESWEGLGYYRRAANLHRLAQVVVQDHDGIVPDDLNALRSLPGVGRYTAGAVACFAFEHATPTVDTNVARVIRRAFHPRAAGARGARKIWDTAQAAAEAGQAGLDLQPGDHGAGGAGLYRPRGAVRGVSGPGGLCVRKEVATRHISPGLAHDSLP